MDVRLPTLNGIEATRQIRILAPESKIIFVSQESAADVVQQALKMAMGYIVKKTIGSDLLPALEAVCQGRRFISAGLSGYYFSEATDAQAQALSIK